MKIPTLNFQEPKAEWVDPATGAIIGTETFTHSAGHRALTPSAPYSIDIALRMKSTR